MKNLLFSLSFMFLGFIGFASNAIEINKDLLYTNVENLEFPAGTTGCSTRTETRTRTRGNVSTTTTTVVSCDTAQEMADYNKAVGIH